MKRTIKKKKPISTTVNIVPVTADVTSTHVSPNAVAQILYKPTAIPAGLGPLVDGSMITTSVPTVLTVLVGLLEPGKELVLLTVIVVSTDDSVAVLIAIIVMMSVKIVGALDPI